MDESVPFFGTFSRSVSGIGERRGPPQITSDPYLLNLGFLAYLQGWSVRNLLVALSGRCYYRV